MPQSREYIVQIVGTAGGGRTIHDNRYLVAWNPHTEFGVLALTSTDDPAKARRFSDARIVFTEWRMVSRVQPIRFDNEPNRPLTAVNVLIEPSAD